jgi:hypothetical protein
MDFAALNPSILFSNLIQIDAHELSKSLYFLLLRQG